MKKSNALSYVMVIAVALLLALNYHIFIVKNNFAPAGLNGIATMIQYKTGFSISYMSLMINIPLSVFAYFFVQKFTIVPTMRFVYGFTCIMMTSKFVILYFLSRELAVACPCDKYDLCVLGTCSADIACMH